MAVSPPPGCRYVRVALLKVLCQEFGMTTRLASFPGCTHGLGIRPPLPQDLHVNVKRAARGRACNSNRSLKSGQNY